MSIEINENVLKKEINQGIVPLGVPAAYKYDTALVENAKALVNASLNQIKNGYGYPFTAATAAAMTDVTKIYVYTGNEVGYTNGNWYYYNGSTWVSGGVYNATALETDKTLTYSGMAADAEVVGAKFIEEESLIDYNKGLAETASANTSNRIDVEINRAVTAERNNASAIENLQADVESLSLKLADSVKLKPVPILSQSDENIDDEFDNNIQGDIFLPVTDETLSQTGYPAEAMATRNAIDAVQFNVDAEIARVGQYIFKNQYKDYGLPVIYLYGDADKLVDKSVTLKDSVQIIFPKYGIDTTLSKVKVQGNSSKVYPKKNFTLTFADKFEAVPGWGKQKKYVVKANFTDISQVRNIGSARLWGAIRNSRISSADMPTDEIDNVIVDQSNNNIMAEGNPMLSTGINGGAVDGFPCMLVINNVYWGLYDFNVPKDGWMARMGGGDRECIVSTDYSTTQAQYFKGLPTMQPSGDGDGAQDFEIEYISDEDDDSWVLPSLTTMISAVMNSTGANYKITCQDYIDIDSAIDYFIFTVMFGNSDGIGKNYLLDTYDGVKWYFNAYDLDNMFGLYNVKELQDHYKPTDYTFSLKQNEHRMFHLIYTYDKQSLCDRYEQLRKGVLSESNVWYILSNLALNIPKAALDYESIRWSGVRATYTNTIEQILNWYRIQCAERDKEIEAIRESI